MDVSGISDGNIRGRGLHSLFRGRRNGPGRQAAGAFIPRAAAPSPFDGPTRTSRRRAIRSFWRKEHGGTALESALAISLAVAAFAGLMEIVGTVLESDRMHRAARAVAQATALDPAADACPAIRRELGLADDFDCATANWWPITVHPGVLPSKLSDALGSASANVTGDMVLVRIDWSRDAWYFPNVFPAANASNNSATNAPDASANPRRVSHAAIGLARSEPRG